MSSVEDSKSVRGFMFDIERYATEDGPGIRTVVFLKGCPLRCRWCANPESQRASADLLYYKTHCVLCSRCIQQCPAHAIAVSDMYGLVTDPMKCIACGLCEKNCFYGARKVSGKEVCASEVIETVLKDKLFYEESGGGITLSGGEPLMQPQFAKALLKLSKENGLHTALETCGFQGLRAGRSAGMLYDEWAAVLPLLDVLYFDIKHVDADKCKDQMRTEIAPLLRTSRFVCDRHDNVLVRIPCIPGFNHSMADMREIFAFIQTLGKGLKAVELLPYHRLGRDKYACLARPYEMGDAEQLDYEALTPYAILGKDMGLPVRIGPC